MQRFFRYGLALGWVLGFLLLLPQSALRAQDQPTGTLRGEVLSDGRGPVSGARITLRGHESTAVSDARGRFVLSGVPPGEHYIEVSAMGFVAGAVSGTVRAGDAATIEVILTPSAFVLDEMVVTAQFGPTDARSSVHRVRTIRGDVAREQGSTDLAEVLSSALNARVFQDAVMGRNLTLQGISGQNVKILMDGVPLVSGEGNQVDLSQLDLSRIERVEIIEGPLSVLYGTNALAGTVNLISRRGTPGRGFDVTTSLFMESVGQLDAELTTQGTWRGTQLEGSLTRGEFSGFSSLEQERTQNWNPRTRYAGTLRSVRPLGTLSAALTYRLSHESSVGLGVPIRTPFFDIAQDRHHGTVRHLGDLTLSGWLNTDRYVELIAGYQEYRTRSERFMVDLRNGGRQRTEDPRDHAEQTFGAWTSRAAVSQAGIAEGRLSIQTGWDVSVNGSAGERVSAERASLVDAGLFGSLNVRLLDGFEVQPALRVLHNNLFDASEVDFLGAGLPVVPSLHLRVAPAERLVARASYAQGFRAPSVRELYYYFHDANHSIDGNPDLKAETAQNLSASLAISGKGAGVSWELEPSVFQNRINNRIYLLQKESLAPGEENKVARTYVNVPSFETAGGTVRLRMSRAGEGYLQPYLGLLSRSGSISLGERFWSREAGFDSRVPLLGRPERLHLEYKYNGPIAEFSLVEGEVVDRTVQGYHLMDASASRDFARHGLTLSGGVKNLLDVIDVKQTGAGTESLVARGSRRPVVSVGWGRTVFLRVTWSPRRGRTL